MAAGIRCPRRQASRPLNQLTSDIPDADVQPSGIRPPRSCRFPATHGACSLGAITRGFWQGPRISTHAITIASSAGCASHRYKIVLFIHFIRIFHCGAGRGCRPGSAHTARESVRPPAAVGTRTRVRAPAESARSHPTRLGAFLGQLRAPWLASYGNIPVSRCCGLFSPPGSDVTGP